MAPPLQGVRVVDLTRILAGPYATMLLADLGADVIKIEHPTRGDDTRAWVPPSAPLLPATPPPSPRPSGSDSESKVELRRDDWSKLPAESAYFLSVNRNKRSIGVNIKDPKGLEIVHELIKKADVLVENYVPGKLNELGLGYEQCRKINDKLIYASITGYGQTGPYAERPGYDVAIEAEAGLMHITGEPDGPPVKVGVAITDLTTGMYTQSAILAALIGRQQTGKGAWIDCSLFESQIASLANIASSWLIAGKEATRQGTSHPSIVPYQNFPTQDGWIMIGAGNDGQFKKFAAILGRPDLPDSELYNSNSARVANRGSLLEIIYAELAKHTTDEWLSKLEGQGFPFAPVNNIENTFAHPQSVARKVVSEVEHPRAGKIKLASPAVMYNGEKMKVRLPPPVLGQHTVEVLREELGYTDERIAQLQKEGVV